MSRLETRPAGLRPPHAPAAGSVRRILGPFHVTGVFWFRFHHWGARVTPSWLLRILVPSFTTFFFFTLFRIRTAIASNLVPVLGPCGFWRRQARIYRTMRLFAWCLTERYENLAGKGGFRWRVEGEEHWQSFLRQGGILLTAHVGNWEPGSMLPATEDRRTIHVVREEEMDSRAQEFTRELLRTRSDGRYATHFASADPSLGMVLLDALRRGEIVALQGDRPRAQGRVHEAAMFGLPFPLPVGPAALARAARAPILPVFILREGRLCYRAVIRPPIEVRETPSREADFGRALERVAGELEWAIREAPHQWFCFAPVWRS